MFERQSDKDKLVANLRWIKDWKARQLALKIWRLRQPAAIALSAVALLILHVNQGIYVGS